MALKNTTLDDLAGVIGFSATLRLAAWYGDKSSLYVPENVEEGQKLVKLIGMSAAKKLSENWGGEIIGLPRLTAYETEERRAVVARLLSTGKVSTREVSSVLRISERRVQQMCRELEVEGLMEPVGPSPEKLL